MACTLAPGAGIGDGRAAYSKAKRGGCCRTSPKGLPPSRDALRAPGGGRGFFGEGGVSGQPVRAFAHRVAKFEQGVETALRGTSAPPGRRIFGCNDRFGFEKNHQKAAENCGFSTRGFP